MRATIPIHPLTPDDAEGAPQRVVKVRRDYNNWVARETMEDYALRYTPQRFRKWSTFRVANTAFGAASFLILEAVGATLLCAVTVNSTGTGINFDTAASGGVLQKAPGEVWSGVNVATGVASFYRHVAAGDAGDASTWAAGPSHTIWPPCEPPPGPMSIR